MVEEDIQILFKEVCVDALALLYKFCKFRQS